MIAYVDTSALVKLFLAESGSQIVSHVWEGADGLVTSAATYPEARAALAAAAREGRITRRILPRSVVELDRRFSSIDVIELRRPLASVAGSLAERYALRGYDAVHLASALAVDGGRTIMLTWDRELARAAGAAGLDVVPPW
ncbi:MAG: type II toxin-antitoxin system VapC family toxin [Actinomycetota bacterium]